MNIHSVNGTMTRHALQDDPGGKRQAILDAALELFAERGFHGTAVPLVAEKAGVGAGTLYRYFESKEALVNALYQHWKGTLATEILSQLDRDKPPRQMFMEFWVQMGLFARKHPNVFEFLELHHHSPYLTKESLGIEQRLLSAIEMVIVEAQRKEAVKHLAPVTLIALVNGAFVGLVKAAKTNTVELSRELLEETGRVMWEAIRY